MHNESNQSESKRYDNLMEYDKEFFDAMIYIKIRKLLSIPVFVLTIINTLICYSAPYFRLNGIHSTGDGSMYLGGQGIYFNSSISLLQIEDIREEMNYCNTKAYPRCNYLLSPDSGFASLAPFFLIILGCIALIGLTFILRKSLALKAYEEGGTKKLFKSFPPITYFAGMILSVMPTIVLVSEYARVKNFQYGDEKYFVGQIIIAEENFTIAFIISIIITTILLGFTLFAIIKYFLKLKKSN